jgi:starvation-inducible DNA-binding protein
MVEEKNHQLKGSIMIQDQDRNDGHNKKLQVLIQPNIGLEVDARHPVEEILNNTLANEALLILKTRSARWNMSGVGFFELRSLFDVHYKQLNDISDEIAERVRMLGGFTTGSLAEYLAHTRLEEQPGIAPDILHLLADHESIIRFLREDVRKCTEEFEDEGTFELLVGVMRLHEKIAWVLRSYIENELVHLDALKEITKKE